MARMASDRLSLAEAKRAQRAERRLLDAKRTELGQEARRMLLSEHEADRQWALKCWRAVNVTTGI